MRNLDFRRLARGDFPMLSHWLAQPQVARWWHHDPSPQAVERDFGAVVDGKDPADVFIASERMQASGRVHAFGLIQRYTFADNAGYVAELAPILAVPDSALSIDYFVGEPAYLGRGYGAAMIRAALASLWRDYKSTPAVIVPVNAANTASWKVLERSGFRRVAEGPLRPDNPIDDCDHYIYRVDRPRG